MLTVGAPGYTRVSRGPATVTDEVLALGQHAVRHLNADGALADRRGDALHVPGAHVAHGEHAGDAGFQHVRRALERPLHVRQVLRRELRTRAYEPLLVQAHAALQPAGIGQRAGHEENVRDVVRFHATGAAPCEALKPAVPREILLDEKNKRLLVRVVNDDLAVAIGRKGQNARLTSRLVGWRLDIEEFKVVTADPRAQAISLLTGTYGFDASIAERLVANGINSPAAVEGVEAADLAGMGFSEPEAAGIIAKVSGS